MATWVPDACTLPTAEQPMRVAEFDDLFATVVRPAVRSAPDTLQIFLPADAAAAAHDLMARETACCSFFAFSVRPSADEAVLELRVPASQVAVLDALQQRVAVARARDGR
jgi:hypothetical protein